MCKISTKILNSIVFEARQSFQFFRKITWFPGSKRACLNLSIGFCLSIIKLHINKSVKSNFMFTSHLNGLNYVLLSFSKDFLQKQNQVLWSTQTTLQYLKRMFRTASWLNIGKTKRHKWPPAVSIPIDTVSACNFTKSNTSRWVFFMFFKLY